MSDEERLKWLKEIEKDIFVCSLESTFVEDAKSCAIHSAIKALENQKTIIEELEKIKAESQSIIDLADSRGEDSKLAYQCQIVINERISELKGE